MNEQNIRDSDDKANLPSATSPVTTNSAHTKKYETTTNYTTADLIITTNNKLTYARNPDLTAARI